MTKTINNIPVSDDDFNKMALLQERQRRIDAEVKLLMREKADTDREIDALLAMIQSPPKVAAAESGPAKAID